MGLGDFSQAHLNLVVLSERTFREHHEWMIASTNEADRDEDDRPLYWDDKDGWVAFEDAQTWTAHDVQDLTLPPEGDWVDACHPDN